MNKYPYHNIHTWTGAPTPTHIYRYRYAILQFFHSCNKHLLNIYYVPGSLLGTENRIVKQSLCLFYAHAQVRKIRNKHNFLSWYVCSYNVIHIYLYTCMCECVYNIILTLHSVTFTLQSIIYTFGIALFQVNWRQSKNFFKGFMFSRISWFRIWHQLKLLVESLIFSSLFPLLYRLRRTKCYDRNEIMIPSTLSHY